MAGKARPPEPDEGPGAGLIVQINGLLPALSPAEQRVARMVLADPAEAARRTITHLAAAAHTSEASVVRFCRSIGLAGYPELRIRLAAEGGRRRETVDASVAGGSIHPGAHLSQIIATVAFNDARAVEETAQQLDADVCEQIVHALLKARRIEVFGAGGSGFVAADFQAKLHRLGRVAYYWPDVHGALASASMLGSGDVAFGISHTGTTRDTIEMLTLARAAGATTVALTNFPRSKISEAADLVVTTAARETTYRSGPLASRLAQLTVLDCLFVALAARTRGKAGRGRQGSEVGHGRITTGKRKP